MRSRPNDDRCKCKDPTSCPLPGKCAADKLVYRATVTTASSAETYVGLTANQFKDRFNQHMGDFRHPERRTATELSTHIWELKDKKIDYTVIWDGKL